MTNTEYKQLIKTTREKDAEFFETLVTYFDKKINNFLTNFRDYDEHENWMDLSAREKTNLILVCIRTDLSCLGIPKDSEEIALNFLEIYREKLYRKFSKEEEKVEEIVVDPEYQELLEEALAIVDSK